MSRRPDPRADDKQVSIHSRKHAAPGGSKVTGLLSFFEKYDKETKPKPEIVEEKKNRRKSFTSSEFKALHANSPNQWGSGASIKPKKQNDNDVKKEEIKIEEVKPQEEVAKEEVKPQIQPQQDQMVAESSPEKQQDNKIEQNHSVDDSSKEELKLEVQEVPKENVKQVEEVKEEPKVEEVVTPIVEQQKDENNKEESAQVAVEEEKDVEVISEQEELHEIIENSNQNEVSEGGDQTYSFEFYMDALNNTNFDLIDLGSKNIDDNELIALLDKLESTGRINTLEKLVLSGNEFEDRGAMRLASTLRENKTIDFLDLKWNMIGIKGIDSLGLSLEFNQTLTSLNLDGNELGEEGAIVLAEHFEKNTSLKYIELKDNFIGDPGAEAIANGLKYHPSLVLLDLTSNEITGHGAEQIAFILLTRQDNEADHNLETIILNTNLIGDEGAVAIANSLMSNSTLTSLQLRSCGIAGEGMVQLAKVLSTKNTHLSELDLNMNLPSIQGEIALNDLAMSNETLYVEWKDPQSESSWSVEDIKEIINHYGPLEILGNILHGFSLAPLIENHKLLGSLEIEDFDVAESFIDEALSDEYVLIGLDMLNTILRRGLSPLEADDFDELEDEDLYLDENTSPLDELPPLQRALYKWIAPLHNILSTPLSEIDTSYGKLQPFGEKRLKTLDVIIALIDEEGPTALLEKFVEHKTPFAILQFLEKFPLHNICHQQVRQFVRVSLRSDTLRSELFNNCKVHNYIMSLAINEWSKPQPQRKPCSGHLYLIIQDILKFSFDKEVKRILGESEEWNAFLQNQYANYVDEIKK